MSSFCNVPFFRLDDLLMEIETAIRVHLHGIISTIIIEKIYNLDSICVCAVFDRFIFSLSVLIIISFA